ncbi:MAG: aldo/keto reductase [Propionibacteriaceae bacterium]|nr:aldo/keto reductase [Propionibacteriaceae bacterium]
MAAPINRIDIPGLERPVARLILGVDHQTALDRAQPVFERYLDLGGNAFDTAWGYGDGLAEQILGSWIEANGVRADVLIVDKGARAEYCTPEISRHQLAESLNRLRTDHVDVYLLHSDNPEVPVGAFVEVLHEHVDSGRARLTGVSNWSLERVLAFNEYAQQHALRPVGVVSNNFSLAEMVDPVWELCLSSRSQAWREWLQESGTPLMPWSSQARGFFTPRAYQRDSEIERAWSSPENWRRRERAAELAEQSGAEPIEIALAWVLSQPITVLPMVGPRTIDELESSVRAFGIELSADQARWLEGEPVLTS